MSTQSEKLEAPPTSAPLIKAPVKKGWAVWVVLALWFAWLLAMAVMSYPDWGKSKIELLSPADHEQ